MHANEYSWLMSLKQKNTKSELECTVSRIGFGWYEMSVMIITGIGLFAEGAQITALAIITLALEDEWNISDTYLGIMGSLAFGGMALGALIACISADELGKLKLIQISLVILLFFGILSAFTPEFWSFTILQVFVGIGNGIGITTISPYITEACPETKRVICVIISQFFFLLGQFYIVMCAFFIMPDLESNHWRILYLVASIPLVLAVLFVWLVPKESPFFLIEHRKYEELTVVLNYIAKKNRKPALSPVEISDIQNDISHFKEPGLSNISILFHENNSGLTYKLVWMWSLTIFSFGGFLFSAPLVIDSERGSDEVMLVMLVSIGLEIPATLLALLFVQKANVSRRILLVLSSFLLSVCCIASALAGYTFLVYIFSGGIIVSICLSKDILYAYTCEVYNSNVRTMALGFHNVIARSLTVFAPILLVNLVDTSVSYVFTAVAVNSVCMFVVSLLLPGESLSKRGKPTENNIRL